MKDHRNNNGVVSSIQVFPQRRAPAKFLRSVPILQDWGLQGGRKSKPGSDRQVLLLEKETLERLGLNPGDLRENITTEGIDLHSLGAGSQIKVGSFAVLEITKYCPPCRRLEEIRTGLGKEVAEHRGMLARVLSGGSVAIGDPIEVVHFVERVERRLPG